MVQPKYYDKIRASQANPPSEDELARFDFSILKRGGGLGAKFAQSRTVHAFLRRFWPVGRIGKLGWAVRHKDVSDMRQRWQDFNVPYGLEMRDLTDGEDFALGVQDGPDYQRQLAWMRAVMRPGDLTQIVGPNVKRLAEAAVEYSGGEIDAVEDLLVRVAVETCADYYGLSPERPIEFAQWLMSMSTLLFADYLGDEDVRKLALSGAARVRRVIDAAIKRAHEIADWQQAPPPPGSHLGEAYATAVRWYNDTLVGRFVALQRADPAARPTNGEIRAMLIGMAVGYVPTGGGAGGNILEVLLERPYWLAQAQEAAQAGQDVRLTSILMEAMRFSPPINPGVPRYVTQTTKLGGATLPEGTMIIAASSAAMFDPRIVANPGRFDPDRPVNMELQFGGPFLHYCIGEQLTRILLLESFKPLLRQKALQRAAGGAGQLEKAGPFPQHLSLTFKPEAGHRFQSMITICVPVTEPVPESELDKLIDDLGNPATRTLEAALEDTKIIHFAHVSAVAGERSDTGHEISPAYLIVELSADGPQAEAIARFAGAMGDALLPLFTLATSARTLPDIHHLLDSSVRRLVASPAPVDSTHASGLNFPGTPELSVLRIKRDAEVAAMARKHLDDHLKSHLASGSQASAALEWVRARMQDSAFRPDLMRPASITLPTARRADRTFPETLASLYGDWSFTGKLVGLLVVALLVHYTLSHQLYIAQNAGLAIQVAVRAAVSLLLAFALTFLGLGVWRQVMPATTPGKKPSTASLLLEHVWVVSSIVAALAIGHFVVFQTAIGAQAWDAADHVNRLLGLLAVLADLVTSLIIGTLVAIIILASLIGFLILLLRLSETGAPPEDFDPKQDDVDALLARENSPGYAQNHIIAVTPLKTNPRWLRRMTLALAFWGIEVLVRHRFRPGFVLDIGTIHFARWFRLPKTDKLVFLSNYDGSWESYLEDFITKAHLGQTAVWSNGVGFPKTSFLLFGGAADGAKFKRWVRRQQVPTRFWYSRFPELTTTHIRNNAMICEGLAKATSASDCQAWVDLFGSQPRPKQVLDYEEIQSLVFSGMPKLHAAELIPVRFPSDPALWQAWLGSLIGRERLPGHETVTAPDTGSRGLLAFGEDTPLDYAGALALSAEGLRHMGLDRLNYRAGGDPDGSTLATFPTGFLDGMASDARARILGDTGPSAPYTWSWVGDGREPHAVLIVYADTSERLAPLVDQLKADMHQRYGLTVLASIRMADLPAKGVPIREPFGFNDSVSQPVMKGTQRFHEGIEDMHVVEAGEFILGYGDNRGDTPPSPVVGAEFDRGILPSLRSDLPGRFPGFEPGRSMAPRDLGRNGSYLVIRQLEQDTKGFADHVEALAQQLQQNYPGAPVTADLIKAKMVGRWPNGSSLVRNPHSQGDAPDNDFLYGVEDPQGMRCPYGAHVRRVLPRDSLSPDHKEQLSISNRHRLLRRGRTYVEDGKTRGLMFMCLNTDIERQFEFVQQTWVTSPNFHGLAEEPDPLISSPPAPGVAVSRRFTIPTPSGPIELRDLQSFVTVRNGGYFFLPGRAALLFLANFAPP